MAVGFSPLNVGSNDRNYQVKDLANAVAEAIPGTKVSINKTAHPDTRSYQVDFSLFGSLATKSSTAGDSCVSRSTCSTSGLRRHGFR